MFNLIEESMYPMEIVFKNCNSATVDVIL